jgi:hypothetical protein
MQPLHTTPTHIERHSATDLTTELSRDIGDAPFPPMSLPEATAASVTYNKEQVIQVGVRV